MDLYRLEREVLTGQDKKNKVKLTNQEGNQKYLLPFLYYFYEPENKQNK